MKVFPGICFVTHPYHRGGVTSWTVDAVNYLAGAGREVQLIGVQPRLPFISGRNRPLIADLIEDQRLRQGLPMVDIAYELGMSSFRAWVLAQEILTKVPTGSVLIPSDDEACWMACAMVADKYKFIGVYHSDNPQNYATYNKYHGYLVGIVGVSTRIVKKLREITLLKTVIPCGIVIPQIGESKVKKNRIVWVGRMENAVKRVGDLIGIACFLKEHNADFMIEVWGHGDYSQQIAKQIQEFQLEDVIILKGWGSRDRIIESMAESKVLLQTSNFEGMSIAVMEALAMGCMVVSSEVSGVEDYARMEEGQELIRLFPTGDLQSAKDAIIAAIASYDDQTANKARAFAEKHFSIATCLEAYTAFSDGLPASEGIMPMVMPGIFERGYSWILSHLRYAKYKMGF